MSNGQFRDLLQTFFGCFLLFMSGMMVGEAPTAVCLSLALVATALVLFPLLDVDYQGGEEDEEEEDEEYEEDERV